MTKVEHTKTHTSYWFNNTPVNVLVTDAELVLVECKPEATKGYFIKESVNIFWYNGNVRQILINNLKRTCPEAKYFQSILISDTEKIEVGDWKYNLYTKAIEKHKLFYGLDESEQWVKILALPEHFSPKHLQDIVDGKLTEGKCLVECESFCAHGNNCPSKGAYDKQHLCDVQYKIKLNPHITIYPVEEKMYTREEVCNLISQFCIDGMINKNPSGDTWISKWFEQNVK